MGVGVGGGGSYPGSARTSAGTSLASSRESSCASCPGITQPFRIAMLGATGAGKTSLVCQFMTSESLHIYDASIGEFQLCICYIQDFRITHYMSCHLETDNCSPIQWFSIYNLHHKKVVYQQKIHIKPLI